MPPVLRKGHPATTDPPRDHVKPDRQPTHNLDAVNATYLTLLEHPFAGACRGSGSGLISIVSRYPMSAQVVGFPMYVCTSCCFQKLLTCATMRRFLYVVFTATSPTRTGSILHGEMQIPSRPGVVKARIPLLVKLI